MRMVALKAKPYCLTVLQDVTIQKAAEEKTHRYTLELQQHAVVLTEMNDKLNLLNSITRMISSTSLPFSSDTSKS